MKKKVNKDINIFIAAHKQFDCPNKRIYVPLQVGRTGKKSLGYVEDNIGDNISKKNSNYCELTGLYWMSKNVKCDIIGLVHYRRYFFDKIFKHRLDDIIDEEQLKTIFNKYDIIVPKKFQTIEKSNYENYRKIMHSKDLDICRDVISELTPEYLDSFDSAMGKRYFYPYNMFIARKDIFDDYVNWLFKILFEVEKRVDINNYSDYDKRIFGFLSERLFNVWLEYHQELKRKELYVYNIEKCFRKQIGFYIAKKILIRC